MSDHSTPEPLSLPSRRRFLKQVGHGFGSLALSSLLHQQSQAAATATTSSIQPPHFPARAKAVI